MKVRRFQVLVSLMLSSQTKDQLTFAAMEKLKQHGLTCRNIINTNETDIAQLIYPVGFWKVTSWSNWFFSFNNSIPCTEKSLLHQTNSWNTSWAIQWRHSSNRQRVVPATRCWRKSGCHHHKYCLGKNNWNRYLRFVIFYHSLLWPPYNIIHLGVDTHVHRIANRLGWTLKATKTPEKTREALEDWLPRSLWGEVNVLFVGFGQQQCTPVKPKCDTCLNQHLCPVGKTQLLKKKC